MICKTCFLDTKAEDFYSSNRNNCKTCLKDKNKAWRKSNPERVRVYRTKNKANEWKKPEVRARRQSYYRRWYEQNGRNRDAHYTEITERWRHDNPEKIAAQNKAKRAVKRGVLIRPNHCDYCHESRRVLGHHRDYSQPLEVDWLCYSCHKRVHSGAITLPER